MSELNKDNLYSDGNFMPGLRDRGQSGLSSGDDTDSYGDNNMYDDGEWWGYKKQTLKQITSGTNDGMILASNTPTLYTFSLHGYTKVLTADIPGAFLSKGEFYNQQWSYGFLLGQGLNSFSHRPYNNKDKVIDDQKPSVLHVYDAGPFN